MKHHRLKGISSNSFSSPRSFQSKCFLFRINWKWKYIQETQTRDKNERKETHVHVVILFVQTLIRWLRLSNLHSFSISVHLMVNFFLTLPSSSSFSCCFSNPSACIIYSKITFSFGIEVLLLHHSGTQRK